MNRDERVFVGLGANLGDAVSTLHAALAQLRAVPGSTVVATSSMYRSAPIEATGPDYINAVAELRTRLVPEELLAHLMAIERGLGRQRHFRNAPRTLDLDLLLFGERQVCTDQLCVPHPRMWHRAFVLAPLGELAPEVIDAHGRGIFETLAQLHDQRIERMATSSRSADE